MSTCPNCRLLSRQLYLLFIQKAFIFMLANSDRSLMRTYLSSSRLMAHKAVIRDQFFVGFWQCSPFHPRSFPMYLNSDAIYIVRLHVSLGCLLVHFLSDGDHLATLMILSASLLLTLPNHLNRLCFIWIMTSV